MMGMSTVVISPKDGMSTVVMSPKDGMSTVVMSPKDGVVYSSDISKGWGCLL